MIGADDVYFGIKDHAIGSGHQERKMPDIVRLGKITLVKAFTLDTAILVAGLTPPSSRTTVWTVPHHNSSLLPICHCDWIVTCKVRVFTQG